MNPKKTLAVAILLALLLSSVPIPALAQDSAGSGSQDKLLIIAPDEFIDKLQPLKRFKDCTGRPTILLSLNQVYADFGYANSDEAEKVKLCIAHYEEHNNVEYVMLVGDVDKFPVRWRWWGLPGQEHWAVSDLYYADLYEDGTRDFDDWDFTDNGLYGEIEFAPDATPPRSINNDRIDFLPDVAVGRVPASEESEVTAYVNKVIAYEMETTPWATWFPRAALYTGSWWSGSNGLKDDVAEYLETRGFANPTKRYFDFGSNQPPPGVPQAIVNDLNSGFGVVNFSGHGNSDCWCFGPEECPPDLCSADLAGLTNSGKLPVVFANACETGMFARMARFHQYKDINGQGHCGTNKPYEEDLPPGAYPYSGLPKPAPVQDGEVECCIPGTQPLECNTIEYDRPCLAETFLFGNPTGSTGAIAYIGARTGSRGGGMDLDRHFFTGYGSGLNVLGDIWKYMVEQYYDQHDLGSSHTWFREPANWEDGHTFDEPQKYILFGDPSLIVGGAFTTTLSGNVYDGNGGPLGSYSRYRITGNVTVPAGQTLTAYPGTSVLFENGTKITAMGTGSNEGFTVNATPEEPVCFMSLAQDPQSEHVIHGMKVSGRLRLQNGGEIKLY